MNEENSSMDIDGESIHFNLTADVKRTEEFISSDRSTSNDGLISKCHRHVNGFERGLEENPNDSPVNNILGVKFTEEMMNENYLDISDPSLNSALLYDSSLLLTSIAGNNQENNWDQPLDLSIHHKNTLCNLQRNGAEENSFNNINNIISENILLPNDCEDTEQCYMNEDPEINLPQNSSRQVGCESIQGKCKNADVKAINNEHELENGQKLTQNDTSMDYDSSVNILDGILPQPALNMPNLYRSVPTINGLSSIQQNTPCVKTTGQNKLPDVSNSFLEFFIGETACPNFLNNELTNHFVPEQGANTEISFKTPKTTNETDSIKHNSVPVMPATGSIIYRPRSIESTLCPNSFISTSSEVEQPKNIVFLNNSQYIKKLSDEECKNLLFKSSNYVERFCCLRCIPLFWGNKEKLFQHFKWHRKQEHFLKLGFMRYMPTDSCSKRFRECPYSKKNLHYHCIKNKCEKVCSNVSDTRIHLTFHKSFTAAMKEMFQRYRANENCRTASCPYFQKNATHYHCSRPECNLQFKYKCDIVKHESEHIQDEKLNEDGFKKFLEGEKCVSENCLFSRVLNHIHCIEPGCMSVVQSNNQMLSHKFEHVVKNDDEKSKKCDQKQNTVTLPEANNELQQELSSELSTSSPTDLLNYDSRPLRIASLPSEPNQSLNSYKKLFSNSTTKANSVNNKSICPEYEQMLSERVFNCSNVNEDNMERSEKCFEDESLVKSYLIRYAINEFCKRQCKLIYKDHYHCKTSGCGHTFRAKNKYKIMDHIHKHWRQEYVTDNFYTFIDVRQTDACHSECYFKGKEKHYHCKHENCLEVISVDDNPFRKLDHYLSHVNSNRKCSLEENITCLKHAKNSEFQESIESSKQTPVRLTSKNRLNCPEMSPCVLLNSSKNVHNCPCNPCSNIVKGYPFHDPKHSTALNSTPINRSGNHLISGFSEEEVETVDTEIQCRVSRPHSNAANWKPKEKSDGKETKTMHENCTEVPCNITANGVKESLNTYEIQTVHNNKSETQHTVQEPGYAAIRIPKNNSDQDKVEIMDTTETDSQSSLNRLCFTSAERSQKCLEEKDMQIVNTRIQYDIRKPSFTLSEIRGNSEQDELSILQAMDTETEYVNKASFDILDEPGKSLDGDDYEIIDIIVTDSQSSANRHCFVLSDESEKCPGERELQVIDMKIQYIVSKPSFACNKSKESSDEDNVQVLHIVDTGTDSNLNKPGSDLSDDIEKNSVEGEDEIMDTIDTETLSFANRFCLTSSDKSEKCLEGNGLQVINSRIQYNVSTSRFICNISKENSNEDNVQVLNTVDTETEFSVNKPGFNLSDEAEKNSVEDEDEIMDTFDIDTESTASRLCLTTSDKLEEIERPEEELQVIDTRIHHAVSKSNFTYNKLKENSDKDNVYVLHAIDADTASFVNKPGLYLSAERQKSLFEGKDKITDTIDTNPLISVNRLCSTLFDKSECSEEKEMEVTNPKTQYTVTKLTFIYNKSKENSDENKVKVLHTISTNSVNSVSSVNEHGFDVSDEPENSLDEGEHEIIDTVPLSSTNRLSFIVSNKSEKCSEEKETQVINTRMQYTVTKPSFTYNKSKEYSDENKVEVLHTRCTDTDSYMNRTGFDETEKCSGEENKIIDEIDTGPLSPAKRFCITLPDKSNKRSEEKEMHVVYARIQEDHNTIFAHNKLNKSSHEDKVNVLSTIDTNLEFTENRPDFTLLNKPKKISDENELEIMDAVDTDPLSSINRIRFTSSDESEKSSSEDEIQIIETVNSGAINTTSDRSFIGTNTQSFANKSCSNSCDKSRKRSVEDEIEILCLSDTEIESPVAGNNFYTHDETTKRYSKFLFNENCGYPLCMYKESQTHFHCVRRGCGVGFCDETKFSQHTATHYKSDSLEGTGFTRYRSNKNCGRAQCLNTHNSGILSRSCIKTFHFHCERCDFVCEDIQNVDVHHKQHEQKDFIHSYGFEKYSKMEDCDKENCTRNKRQVHYHCLKCNQAVSLLSYIRDHRCPEMDFEQGILNE